MKGRKMKRTLVMISILAAFILAGGVTAAVASEGCVSDSCHSDMGTKPFVHGPVGAGQCVICHEQTATNHPSNSGSSDFALAFNGGKELCFGCHERLDQNTTVHKPVETGDCSACHDPHQSDAELMLKFSTTSDLCFACHDPAMLKQKNMHGPVAAGDCNICHNPHSSPYPNLTEDKGSDLCLLCHVDRMEEFNRKYIHGPVMEDCSKCHNPHGSEHVYMLSNEGKQLCFACHTRIKEIVEESKVQHSALKQGECTSCHTPHSSNYPRQLKSPTKDNCYVCHTDMGAQVAGSRNQHGPVAQNDCYACHDPHGSNYTMVLKKPFPATFYMPYKTENYALCFDCHNKDIALNQFTTKLTDFRNGDLNLHYLHVNKDPKGRSCKACHEVHAGNQDKHIRKEVPFGAKWKLPVNYTKNDTGGNCVVGCHKPKDYDRENPVTY
ncbi:MAG: cytochrome C [Deltaproteobacteria bacterium]|nr:MAG: cytochrome C [Deltaproteobacteria bacterium]